ncbi:hypothetical protein MON38_21325 [Hymenobacter sp. DH14]|uniref:Uncharacterized protein n=1 Tax=Hymenobacter cyanobacteriorum TaxID=2926463 RepID=A0A9X1VIU4_9BACT|nr:hypothetical protein [Hymenobacter cyanobacteriorum]MCI1189974.1 hypothetical protein [Hymenobacter cyanobacteriorum]
MKQIVTMMCVFLGLLSGSAGTVHAQTKPAPATPAAAAAATAPRYQPGKLSTDPLQYISDVQAMMASTNNAGARVIAARLKELWGSNSLTASQQARIVAISQTMLAKKFRPRPHFETLFNALVNGKMRAKLSDQQMDQFLDVLTQTLANEAPEEADRFLASSNRFFNGGYLYRTGYNTLRAVNGTISFAYTPLAVPQSNLEFGASAPAPKEAPLPAAPKPVAKKPVAAAAKPAAKPAPKKKKASSDGWDTADLWSSPSNSGWGDDDGWGAPVKKKPAPAKKPVAKTTAKPAAATPASAAAPVAKASDFDQPAAFTPSALPYDEYTPPPVRGPVLKVENADMFMATGGDSVFIKKVSGSAVFNSHRFVATSGQFVWSIRTNLVTADMGPFDFDMTKPEFTAQPVTVTYPFLLEAPVKGALSYKSVRRKPGQVDTGYPRFISLTNDARIKNLGQNIQYRGGLSMAGFKVLSAALDGSLSNLTVSLDGKPKFRASSRAYVLGDSVITASRAGITIYEGAKDSITHPGVTLKYLKSQQQLKLAREEGLYKNTPYSDSYHQLEIRTEALNWDLRKSALDFAVLSAKNQQSADFESKEFFTNDRYQQLKSINRLHPLQMLVGYSQTHGNLKAVNVSNLATDLGTSEANMRSAMSGLARDGYVAWNPQTGEVTILPKGTHYVASARDKKDYDHIAIKSLSGSGKNATLNLNTNELTVRGVQRFNFSDDSATVYVKPDSAIIRIGQDRNITFGGTVVASAMRFKGRDFKFDYKGFYVDMAKIDSIVIRSETKDKKGRPTGKKADFALTNRGKVSTGRLYINDPKNKSARKKMGQYPAFDSKSGANVYFRKQDVLGGAYDSTLVFDIPPFKLDSLNGLSKSAAGFEGTFRSGGIIPDIKTKLTLQEDGALGFAYDVPKDGFPLYKGKGRVFDKVRMDGRGLQADGMVTYQTGTFNSDSFVLYRDSVVAVGTMGNVAAKHTDGVDIPKMALPRGYIMNWKVKQDSMFLTTPPGSDAPIRLYSKGDAKSKTVTAYNFKGTALLTPTSAGGDGRLDGPQSYIKSPEFTFKSDSYSGRHATLNVKSAEANKPALSANEVEFDYNLKNGYADFKREKDSKASIDLPYSKFRTTLSGGHWDFKKKEVRLRVAPGNDSTKSYFYATNSNQLGLKFKASNGIYDLARYQMKVGGVPYIAAADAWIIPDSGHVNILAAGRLQRLRNAGVVLDSLAKFHKLYNGNIDVLSKESFAGTGEYIFKTAHDSVALRFGSFGPDQAAVMAGKGKKFKRDESGAAIGSENGTAEGPATVATAVVSSASKFQLTPRIGYRGNVELNSRRRGFAFTGEVQLQFGKNRNLAQWVAVKDSIDPKNFSLNLNDVKAEDGAPLLTGIFLSDQTDALYPLYAAAVPNSTDLTVFKVDGKLSYDQAKEVYTISRNDPADANAYEGSALTYTDATNTLNFHGPMSFIGDGVKDFKMVGAGIGTANPDSARYTVETLLGIDVTLPPKALDLMANELAKTTKNLPEAQTGSTNELYNLAQFIGNKGVDAYSQRRGFADALVKLSPKLAHTIVLNRVNLRWNDKRRAWYSVGPIGIAGVGKQPLNSLINGYVEIRRESGGDVVQLYLEADATSWYYFKFANNLLLVKSQNEDFDGEIAAKAKGEYETATSYGAFLGDFADVDNFRQHFQKDFLGIKPKPLARASKPAAAEPAFDEVANKKKKKKDAVDEALADPGTPAPETAATSSKKKKKAKADDPFGDGVMEDPAPAPTKKAAAPAPTPAAKPAAKATPADSTAAATKAAPDKAPATGTPATGAAPANEPPTPETPVDFPNAPDKKEAARLAKEAEKQKKEEERLKKEEEKKKKEEEKQKKKAGSDPFGDS